uniref:Uncharacterized protein n=1 Tax=Arundo donax TaxID=35708 RepID=A0A0A9BLL0_ARUDO
MSHKGGEHDAIGQVQLVCFCANQFHNLIGPETRILERSKTT